MINRIQNLIIRVLCFFLEFPAIILVNIHTTSISYRAWKITTNNGNIAGKDVYRYTMQPIVFHGDEQIDVIPYPHKTVKGNCIVEVKTHDTRYYYRDGNIVYTRLMRFTGKACSRIEASWNKKHENDWVSTAMSEIIPEYIGCKFSTVNVSQKSKLYYTNEKDSCPQ